MMRSARSTFPMTVDHTSSYEHIGEWRRRSNVVLAELADSPQSNESLCVASGQFLQNSYWIASLASKCDPHVIISDDSKRAAVHIGSSLIDSFSERTFQFDVEPRYTATAYFDEKILNRSKRIFAEISELFSEAENITIEAGIDNDFSISLEQTVEQFGETALAHIEALILKDKTSVILATETLKYIGCFASNRWHDARHTMIEHCLTQSKYAWVRDGAGLGISFMDDPQSIPVLEEAIERECNEELKEDLIQVLEQLQETLLESQ